MGIRCSVFQKIEIFHAFINSHLILKILFPILRRVKWQNILAGRHTTLGLYKARTRMSIPTPTPKKINTKSSITTPLATSKSRMVWLSNKLVLITETSISKKEIFMPNMEVLLYFDNKPNSIIRFWNSNLRKWDVCKISFWEQQPYKQKK